MRKSCEGCINALAPAASQLGAQPVEQLARADISLIARLQPHEDEASVGRTAAPSKRHHVVNRGILFDDVYDVLGRFLHRLEGSVLRTLNAAVGDAIILLREKSLRYDHKKDRY